MSNLSFKTFLIESENRLLEEEYQLLSEFAFEEGLWDIAKGVVKGTANLVGQTFKGAGNIVKGAVNTTRGLARTGAGAAQVVTGGFKPGWENIKQGVATTASGVGSGLKGAAQLAGAPVTAVLRGVQASGEKLGTTVDDGERNWMQKTFGLNTWDQQAATLDAEKKAEEEYLKLNDKYHKLDDKFLNLFKKLRANIVDLSNEFGFNSNKQVLDQLKAIIEDIKQNFPKDYYEDFANKRSRHLKIMEKYEKEEKQYMQMHTPNFNKVARQFQQAKQSGDEKTARNLLMHMKTKYPTHYQAAVEKARQLKAPKRPAPTTSYDDDDDDDY